jgi:hypothetical protein
MINTHIKHNVLYLFSCSMFIVNITCAMDNKPATPDTNKIMINYKSSTGTIKNMPLQECFYQDDAGKWHYLMGSHKEQLVKNPETLKRLERAMKPVIAAAVSSTDGLQEALDLLFKEDEENSLAAPTTNESDDPSASEDDEEDNDNDKDDEAADPNYVDNGNSESSTSDDEAIAPQTTNQPTISSPATEKLGWRTRVSNIWHGIPGACKGLWNKAYQKRIVLVQGGALAIVTIAGVYCFWYFYPNIADATCYISGQLWTGCVIPLKTLVGRILSDIFSSEQAIGQAPLNRNLSISSH